MLAVLALSVVYLIYCLLGTVSIDLACKNISFFSFYCSYLSTQQLMIWLAMQLVIYFEYMHVRFLCKPCMVVHRISMYGCPQAMHVYFIILLWHCMLEIPWQPLFNLHSITTSKPTLFDVQRGNCKRSGITSPQFAVGKSYNQLQLCILSFIDVVVAYNVFQSPYQNYSIASYTQ